MQQVHLGQIWFYLFHPLRHRRLFRKVQRNLWCGAVLWTRNGNSLVIWVLSLSWSRHLLQEHWSRLRLTSFGWSIWLLPNLIKPVKVWFCVRYYFMGMKSNKIFLELRIANSTKVHNPVFLTNELIHFSHAPASLFLPNLIDLSRLRKAGEERADRFLCNMSQAPISGIEREKDLSRAMKSRIDKASCTKPPSLSPAVSPPCSPASQWRLTSLHCRVNLQSCIQWQELQGSGPVGWRHWSASLNCSSSCLT